MKFAEFISLCIFCDLCVFVVDAFDPFVHHKDTKGAQRIAGNTLEFCLHINSVFGQST